MNARTAFSRLSFWCCLALWWMASSVVSQAATSVPIGDPAKSKSSIEAASIFSGSPHIGFDTIRFTVRNESNDPMTFNIRSNNTSGGYRDAHTYEGEQRFVAPKQQTSTHIMLVPVCTIPELTSSSGYYYFGEESRISVTGEVRFDFNLENRLSKEDVSVALSNDLVTGGAISRINSERFGSSSSSYGRNPIFAAGFEPGLLPADWRTLSGFDYVSFSETSWLGMDAAVRASILQWVGFGGCLSIYSSSESWKARKH